MNLPDNVTECDIDRAAGTDYIVTAVVAVRLTICADSREDALEVAESEIDERIRGFDSIDIGDVEVRRA